MCDGRGAGQGSFAIKDEPLRGLLRAAGELQVHSAHKIAYALTKIPGRNRVRPRGRFARHRFDFGWFLRRGDSTALTCRSLDGCQSIAARADLRVDQRDWSVELAEVDGSLAVLDVSKGCGEGVEVGLRNRVELVVVAAGTVRGQSEIGLSRDADDLLQLVLPGNRPHFVVAQHRVVNPGDQCASRLDRVRVGRCQQISGDLPAGEFVIGEIGVQRANDPVAVGPRVGPNRIALESVGLTKADDIQPMPCPAFSVVRAGEQAVNQFLVRGGRLVGDKRLHFVGRGRQANQVERHPADQRTAIRRPQGRERFPGQAVVHKPVNRMLGRSFWQVRSCDRPKRPPVVAGTLLGAEPERVDPVAAPLRPGLDPLTDQLPFGLRQWFAGRHLTRFDAIPDRTGRKVSGDQTAFPRFPGTKCAIACGEVELALGVRARMTGQTPSRQKGSDIPLEIRSGPQSDQTPGREHCFDNHADHLRSESIRWLRHLEDTLNVRIADCHDRVGCSSDLPRVIPLTRALDDLAHRLQPEPGHLLRVAIPEVLPKQFQRQPARVANLGEQLEKPLEVVHSGPGQDAVFVALQVGGRFGRNVVEMTDSNLFGPKLSNRLHATAAARDVKRIEHDRTRGVSGAVDNIERQVDRVQLLDEAQELHGGFHAQRQPEFEQFAIVTTAGLVVRGPHGWAGDNMHRTNRRRLIQLPQAVAHHGQVLVTSRFKPASKVDRCGDREFPVGQCGSHFTQGSTGGEMLVELVMPQLDCLVPRPPGGLNLPEDGRGADGAAVQAVSELSGRHYSHPLDEQIDSEVGVGRILGLPRGGTLTSSATAGRPASCVRGCIQKNAIFQAVGSVGVSDRRSLY